MAVHKGVGHYGAPITLDQAKEVMAAAEAKARQNDWNARGRNGGVREELAAGMTAGEIQFPLALAY